MKAVTVLAVEGILMPYWVADEQDVVLKVKDKFIGSIEPLCQGKVYSTDAEFESYCIEKENQDHVEGYLLKAPQIKSCAIDIDSD